MENRFNIYCISGMGADKRAFQLLRIENANLIFLDWEIPRKGESLEEYLERFSEKITDKTPLILGLSFGGIIAQALAEKMNAKALLLVSTVKRRSELPVYMRLGGALGLQRLIPFSKIMKAKSLTYFFFGAKTEVEKRILDTIIGSGSERLIEWSIDQLLGWKPERELTIPFLHVHGKRDKIFPSNLIKDASFIEDGTHFMILVKAKVVNSRISKFLKELGIS